MRRSWVEINLDVIKNNYKIYQNYIGNSMSIMSVVKANAYGHGDVKVAEALQTIGNMHFAVSNITEAIKLRTNGIKGQILVLGYTPLDCIEELLKYDITQAILSKEYLYSINLPIKTQFAIDTGMNRIGIKAENIGLCEELIRVAAERTELTGIFTHLCAADNEEEYDFTNEQISKFMKVANKVNDLHLPYIHCMNSAGGLWHNNYGNLARLGIVLYGLKPNINRELPEGIKPALIWKSVITMVKTIYPGESVGYDRSYISEKKMDIATVCTGYADGYSRLLSNKGFVWINGTKVPIIGKVCMDQFMVDITNVKCKAGDEVVLLWDNFSADDMAKVIDTIGYEVVCNISSRVERYYV